MSQETWTIGFPMKYRDAKHLKSGDQVKHTRTGALLIVSDIEILGSLNIVRINCTTMVLNHKVVVYNSEVE